MVHMMVYQLNLFHPHYQFHHNQDMVLDLDLDHYHFLDLDLDLVALDLHLVVALDLDTCIMDDDMQKIYPKFKEMDCLIIATPIMTMGIPGKLKSMIDRFQVFFMAKYMRKNSFIAKERRAERKGLFICISGMNIPDVFVGVKLTVRAFFDIIDCQYSDELLISDMDTIRDITAHPDLLEAAYQKGYLLGKSVTE